MSKWQFYDCIDGCGEIVKANAPSRCTKCKEKHWREVHNMGKPGRPRILNYREVLIFISNFKRKNTGISPSIREITDGCELYSTSITTHILNVLEEEGKIERIGGHRSIRLVGEKYIPPKDL